MLPAVLLALVTAPALVGPQPQVPSPFPMHELARLPFYADTRFVCGDADGDGHREVYLIRDQVYALEYLSGSQFDSIPLGFLRYCLTDLGDADLDGKADLVATESQRVWVYEARRPGSLPDSLVWEQLVLGSHVPTLTELDGDSLWELAVRYNEDRSIRLYECMGDNSYELSASLRVPESLYTYPSAAVAQTHDMDGDGTPELFIGTSRAGYVLLFEAVADDSFECVATCSLHVRDSQMTAIGTANDMDRDGRPEAIAFGVDPSDVSVLAVLESPSNDSLQVVWQSSPDAAYMAWWEMAVGDVDGDSIEEFAFTDGLRVRLYQCAGQDSFNEVWQTRCTHDPVGLYDINSDGRCELFYRTSYETVIMAYGDSVGIIETKGQAVGGLDVGPTVTRGAPIRVAGLAEDAEVEVVDAAGKVVARPKDGVWNPRGVSPGAYFMRVRTGNQTVVQKVLVLR